MSFTEIGTGRFTISSAREGEGMKITIEQMFAVVGVEIAMAGFIINLITGSTHYFTDGGMVLSYGFVFIMQLMFFYGLFALFYFLSKAFGEPEE